MLTLNFTKFPILETDRLILREHDLADAETLFAMRTNETVMKGPKIFLRSKILSHVLEMVSKMAITWLG
jgi:hypothetical protein